MRVVGRIFRMLFWLPVLVATIAVLPRLFDAIDVFVLRHDPVAVIRYHMLGKDAADYSREIEAALKADDAELARSITDLAESNGVAIEPALRARIADAEGFSLTRTAGEVWQGVSTGRADSPTAFGAALAADLTVVGDIRDLAIEAQKVPDQDNLTVALAATGIVLTVALAPSGATALPAKVGVSALKAAKKLRLLAKPLEAQLVRLTRHAVNADAMRSLMRSARSFDLRAMGNDVGRLLRREVVTEIADTGEALRGVMGRQGYRATLQTLGRAESTTEIKSLARVSERYGTRYRGALVLTRGAKLTLRVGEWFWHFAGWLLAAIGWALSALWLLYRFARRVWQLVALLLRLALPARSAIAAV